MAFHQRHKLSSSRTSHATISHVWKRTFYHLSYLFFIPYFSEVRTPNLIVKELDEGLSETLNAKETCDTIDVR